MNLTDIGISYIIISAHKSELNSDENLKRSSKLETILYAKEYTIQHIRGYYNNKWEDSYLAWNESSDNQELKKDALFLINEFNQESVIIKYKDEVLTKKLYKDGKEEPLALNMYDSDMNNKSYVIQGLSFSFVEQKQYKMTTDKSQLKSGMIVEICNNNQWSEKMINDVEKEWDSMYRLFAKHNKLRFSI